MLSHFKIMPQNITGRMRERARDVAPHVSTSDVEAIYDAMYHASPVQAELGSIGPGTPHTRFKLLVAALQRRFPPTADQNLSSVRTAEAYIMDAIDDLIERNNDRKITT